MAITEANNSPEQENKQENKDPQGQAAANTGGENSIFTAEVSKRVISTDESLPPQSSAETSAENPHQTEGTAPSGDMITNTGANKDGEQADADAASG